MTIQALQEISRVSLSSETTREAIKDSLKIVALETARAVSKLEQNNSLPETPRKVFYVGSVVFTASAVFLGYLGFNLKETQDGWLICGTPHFLVELFLKVINSGLNLEAECKTQGCPAFGERVWVHVGYGELDYIDALFRRSIHCPLCDQPTKKPLRLGFHNCEFEIKGRTYPPERRVFRIVGSIAQDKLGVFNLKREWLDCTLSARPLGLGMINQ